ncbi:MAG: methyltransferase [Deltaproteobacteria bacterium]|nr:methyltransferase [Deltaproteobacteria bacterium]
MPFAITEDTLFNGLLSCRQHGAGYRFSVDAVLLAHFCRPRPQARILDLGAGCGVISLILCYRNPRIKVTALELQPRLAELIAVNIELNRFQERITLLEGDLRTTPVFFAPETFDWVVCNPPYGKLAAGRQNPDIEQAVCRHEIHAELTDIVRAISFNLKNRGRAALIYPASRAALLLSALKTAGLEPKKLQIVYSYPGGVGKLVLVEAVKNGGEELIVPPPFFIYEKQGGNYTAEMARLYAP